MRSAMTTPPLQGFTTLPTYAACQTIQGASSVAVLGKDGIRAWRHEASGVRFVLFAAPGPLVSATILVGTEPVSNAGHPHTLEHIIFLGSQDHPERGYLDNLACRCLADGTNAWTENEYTAYTTMTAGFDGFAHLLPCFLDHVMRPRINAASFASEVYHIRGDGKEAGVVFCEMQARENTEADLSTRAMMESLFEGTSLSFESGGLCGDIRRLSNEDIARFHHDQYCGANITVIVGGGSIDPSHLLSCVKPLLDDISSQPGYSRGQPRWQTPLRLLPLPPASKKIVRFPCPDEDIGTLLLVWRGPGVSDRRTTIALNLILRYLCNDVWSPLSQKFVEIEEQLASEVYFSLDTYLDVSAMSLGFAGVEHVDTADDDEEDGEASGETNGDTNDEDMDEESSDTMEEETESFLLSGKLEEQLMQFLREIVKKGKLPGGICAMHSVIDKELESKLTELESGAHEAVPLQMVEEVVYAQRGSLIIGEETRGTVAALAAMKDKDEQFWVSLLNNSFVDAPRVEIVMVPDAKLADELAEGEQKAITERVDRFGVDRLAKIGMDNERRISSLETRQFAADVFPPIPSTMNISRWPYTVSREAYTEYSAQTVTIDTDFVHCSMFFDTSNMSLEQRMFLPILCELLPSCDILLEDGSYIPYTDNARMVSEMTASTDRSGISVGFNESAADQCVVVHFAAMPKRFLEATQVMLQTFFQAEITTERLSAASQSMQATVTSDLRDGEDVLAAAMGVVPFLKGDEEWQGEIPNYVISSIHGAYPLISFMCEEFTRKKPRKQMQRMVIRKMHETLSALRNLSSNDVFVQIAGKHPHPAHDTVKQVWSAKRAKFATNIAPISREAMVKRAMGQLPHSRKIGAQLSELIGKRSVGKVIGIAGVESCSLDIAVDSPVYTGHADWSALTVLTEMLCRMEGPLCNAVRGAGLAYGVGIGNLGFRGQLVGTIYECSSPTAAWDAVCKCLEDLRTSLDKDPKESGLDVDLETAKASTLFSLNSGRSTPESIAVGAISRSALGAPASPGADRLLEEMVEKVTLSAVADVFDRHVARLSKEEGRMVVVTCGQGMVHEIVEGFRKCRRRILLDEVGIEELCPRAVVEVVARLQKG